MESKQFPYSVGFIGAGNMAKAIGSRILESGIVKPSRMILSAPSDRNLQFWREKGAETTNSNSAVIRSADIVIIAVKPQYFEDMLKTLDGEHRALCFVSIMVGMTIETVRKSLENVLSEGKNFEVMKVMPNTPAMVGAGCSLMALESPNGQFGKYVKQLMETTGTCELIPEQLMNACGALSASTPAYLYMVIEALADGGVQQGIPRDLAYRLAAQSMAGSGRMGMESGKLPAALKDEVCSPGGTTIAGVHELEKAGIRGAFMSALAASVQKSYQLARKS